MTAISFNRSDLADALNAGASVVERSQADAFQNVRVHVERGQAVLTFSDTENWLQTTVRADADSITATTFPCALFAKAAAAMEGDSLSVDTTEGKAVIRSGRSRLSIATIPADHFPMPEWPALDGDVAVVNAKAFAEALIHASYASPDIPLAKYIPAVVLDVGEEVSVYTVDGNRLAADAIPNDGESGAPINLAIKASRILTTLARESEGVVRFVGGERAASFEIGNWRMLTRVVDGTPADMAKVIAERTDNPIIFDAKEMRRALGRLSLVSDNYSRGLKIEVAGDAATLSIVNNKIGDASEVVTVGYEGEPQTLGFSLPFMRDAIRNFSDGDVEMHVFSPVKRAVFESRDGIGGVHMIGPFAV